MPDPVFETITAGRDFDHPRSAIYAHWVSPETRQRWEAGPDTGMSYDAFDTRPGGTEIVRVTHEGQEVGHMVQRIVAVEEDTMLVSQIEAGVYALLRAHLASETNFSPLPEYPAGVKPDDLIRYHITRLMWREFVNSMKE